MNFDKKLDVILELFDIAHSKDAMVGVIKKDIYNMRKYIFADHNLNQEEDPVYVVMIKKINFEQYNYGDRHIKNIIKAVSNVSIPNILTDAIYNIDLMVENTGFKAYDLTGLGNQNFVYGKMFACIKDYFMEFGIPALVKIVPAQPAMALVYDRFLKTISISEGLKYNVVYENYYVLNNVLAAAGIGEEDLLIYKKMHDKNLSDIRKQKREQRKKQIPGWGSIQA